jgi:hypothetical protein
MSFKEYSKNRDIDDWIQNNVPKEKPKDYSPNGYGRCVSYAAALAKLFNGKLIKGNPPTKPDDGDTSHFWVEIDGKKIDPTAAWFPNQDYTNGKEIDIDKNLDFFTKDPVYTKLINGEHE